MGTSKANTEIVKNAIRRFYHLPMQTIARHILNTHGDQFNNDLDLIRSRIRYYMGKMGENHRQDIASTELFRDCDIQAPSTWRKIRTPYKLPVGRWLLLCDVHVPFHEPVAVESAVKFGQAEGVDGVFLNGDIWDCAALSFWPNAHRDFNREVELFIDFLDWLRGEFPTQKIVYKPGNHEYRMPRYFLSHAPELVESPIAAMETVLGFEARGIEFLDYHQLVLAGKLPIIHGHEVTTISRAVNPARGLFMRTKTFSACSHCHSTSEHSTNNIHGELLTTWSFGCLCDLHPDYNPYNCDWNWGFGIIEVGKGGHFEVTNKRILPSGQVV